MGAIYRAVCVKNGKVYVGQTTKAGWEERYAYALTRARWMAKAGRRLRPFDKAILKHGFESFSFRDLMTNVPNEWLDGLERFFIQQYRSNQKRFGYNVEHGGNKQKDIPAHVVRKIQEANWKRRKWRHADFGEMLISVAEIAALDPCATVNGLQKVVAGNSRVHAGWICLEPLRKLRVSRRVVHVWSHTKFGTVVSSTAGLVRLFPDQHLRRQELAYVANPEYKWTKSHRGWSWLRRATDEEETECCVQGNL